MIVNGWQLSDRYHDCSKRIQHGTIQSCLGYGASQFRSWGYETHEGDMCSTRIGEILESYVNVILASRGE